jgi:ATP-dependent DNA ligase
MTDKPIKPMLCEITEEKELPALTASGKYIFEPKLDGIRMITVVKDQKVRLFARSGAEKTHLFPDLQISTKANCILDGEVVSGSSFNNIQHRANRIEGIAQSIKDFPAQYKVFDILAFQDISLMSHQLEFRKGLLDQALIPTENVSPVAYVADGVALFEMMKQNHLEGVVGKKKDSLYHENAREWLKVKCWQEGNFWAVGYTPGTGWRASTFGALVLASCYNNTPDGHLCHVGEVGTGFVESDIRRLYAMMSSSQATCPFAKEPEPAVWVKPFKVKIKYLEFSNAGILRFPVFKGVI